MKDYLDIAYRLRDCSEEEVRGLLEQVEINSQSLTSFYHVFSKFWHKRIEGINIVGTGGDGKNTFNISTAASGLLAARGMPVLKFGNRAATSVSGNVDVLHELGIKCSSNWQQAKENSERYSICFIDAREVYPEFRKFAKARSEIKRPTIFNYLGPLLCPVEDVALNLGVKSEHDAAMYIKFFGENKEHFPNWAVVCGEGYDDAIPGHLWKMTTPYGVLESKDNSLTDYKRLTVSSPKQSAEVIRGIFSGEIKDIRRAAVCLNAGLAYCAYHKTKPTSEGLGLAMKIMETMIDTGEARKKLEDLAKN